MVYIYGSSFLFFLAALESKLQPPQLESAESRTTKASKDKRDAATKVQREKVQVQVQQPSGDPSVRRPRRMHKIFQFLPTAALQSCPTSQELIDTKTGTVRLRLLMDQVSYRAVQDATVKAPISAADWDERVPDKLRESIAIWVNARARLFDGEVLDASSLRLSCFAIEVSICSRLVHVYQHSERDVSSDLAATGVPVYILGDAACALPYFKSLHFALKCALSLGTYIASGHLPAGITSWMAERGSGKGKGETRRNPYEQFVHLSYQVSELPAARLKDSTVSSAFWSLRSSAAMKQSLPVSRVPLTPLSWSTADLEQFKRPLNLH